MHRARTGVPPFFYISWAELSELFLFPLLWPCIVFYLGQERVSGIWLLIRFQTLRPVRGCECSTGAVSRPAKSRAGSIRILMVNRLIIVATRLLSRKSDSPCYSSERSDVPQSRAGTSYSFGCYMKRTLELQTHNAFIHFISHYYII